MLELQTLGTVGLRVRVDDGSQAQIVQPKRLALLGYLALAPRRRCRRRDTIIALFWPGLDEEHARGALNQALRYLRRALGDGAIVAQGDDEVGLDRELVGCDAVRFAELCQAGQLEEALAIYQGSFLDDHLVADAGPEYHQWVSEERTRLRLLATGAATTLAERAERLTDLSTALGWARRAALIAPGDEVVVARVIRLLAETGDRAAALREYEGLRQRLKEEFQVAPSHETQALVSRILNR